MTLFVKIGIQFDIMIQKWVKIYIIFLITGFADVDNRLINLLTKCPNYEKEDKTNTLSHTFLTSWATALSLKMHRRVNDKKKQCKKLNNLIIKSSINMQRLIFFLNTLW